MTLKERLYRYLQNRPGQWIASGELQRLTTERTRYTAANATRRLRELAEDGELEVEYRERNHAYYKFTGTITERKIEIINGRAVERVVTKSL